MICLYTLFYIILDSGSHSLLNQLGYKNVQTDAPTSIVKNTFMFRLPSRVQQRNCTAKIDVAVTQSVFGRNFEYYYFSEPYHLALAENVRFEGLL